jgi:hypothetical protein
MLIMKSQQNQINYKIIITHYTRIILFKDQLKKSPSSRQKLWKVY